MHIGSLCNVGTFIVLRRKTGVKFGLTIQGIGNIIDIDYHIQI